jgi:amino acid transporter
MWTQVAAGFVLASLTAAYYPGANIPLSYWLIYPISCSVGVLYILFSAAMPRTGGDYIYVSRALHPLAGFVSNFMFNANIAGWIGTWVAFAVPAGLCAFFASWGIETGNAYFSNIALWLINPWPYFLITALLNVLSGIIVYYGAKWTARFCWLFFILAVIGISTMDIYMATAGTATFVAGWNQLSGTTYDAIIAAAQKAGYFLGFSAMGTILGVTYAYQNTIGYTTSVYYAGEIKTKNMLKTQLLAIIGSTTMFTIITSSIGFGTYAGVGQQFFHAISQLYWIGASPLVPSMVATLGVPDTIFLAYMHAPLWVLVLVLLAGIAGPWGLGLPMVFTNSRCSFAWGFDRIYPTQFASISRKTGSPTLSIFYNVAFGNAIAFVYIFLPSIFGAMTYTMMLWAAGEIVVAVAGITFAYKRKDILAAAPKLVRAKIGPLPIITFVAIVVLAEMIFMEYAIAEPLVVGLVNPVGGVALTILFVGVPIVIYYVSVWYNKRKGIPIDLVHRTLPPE